MCFAPSCYSQLWLLFFGLVFVLSQSGTHQPDRRDENELSSSAEEKIRERQWKKSEGNEAEIAPGVI